MFPAQLSLFEHRDADLSRRRKHPMVQAADHNPVRRSSRQTQASEISLPSPPSSPASPLRVAPAGQAGLSAVEMRAALRPRAAAQQTPHTGRISQRNTLVCGQPYQAVQRNLVLGKRVPRR